MSTLSISHHILMSLLQKQNIKREIAEKAKIVSEILPTNIEKKTDLKKE